MYKNLLLDVMGSYNQSCVSWKSHILNKGRCFFSYRTLHIFHNEHTSPSAAMWTTHEILIVFEQEGTYK